MNMKRTNAFRNGVELMPDSSIFEMVLEDGSRKTVTVQDVRELVDYVQQLEVRLAEIALIVKLIQHQESDEVKH